VFYQESPGSRQPPEAASTDFALALSLLQIVADRKTLRSCLADEVGFPGVLERLPGGLHRRVTRRRLAQHGRRLRSAGIEAIAIGERDFPALLAAIPDAPLVLHHRGSLSVLGRPAVAVVGARRATASGRAFARNLAMELTEAGAVVVSGLALGVDAAAHLGALEAGGATVAVLGSGPDQIQPMTNLPLADRILATGGLILSEYSPGTPAAPFRFPERNRIISGLSRGVVVVEASSRSGSLITARLAAEQGREVMAVPGVPGYAGSSGTNRLLKNGAALIESAADVLLAIGSDVAGVKGLLAVPDAVPQSPALQRLLDLLDGQARTLDDLACAAGEPLEVCAAHLTALELEGFVQRVAGGYIRRPSDF
jgi:DNA processing protein